MTSDKNKHIASITYAQGNLPVKILFENGNYIKYTYSADGEKVRTDYRISNINASSPVNGFNDDVTENEDDFTDNIQIVASTSDMNASITPPVIGGDTDVNILSNTRYNGNHIYENGALKMTLFDGGYISYSSGTNRIPTQYYYLRGHQGNNRVVVNQSGSVVQVNDYTPFTQTVNQRYKYNGKELDMMYIKYIIL